MSGIHLKKPRLTKMKWFAWGHILVSMWVLGSWIKSFRRSEYLIHFSLAMPSQWSVCTHIHMHTYTHTHTYIHVSEWQTVGQIRWLLQLVNLACGHSLLTSWIRWPFHCGENGNINPYSFYLTSKHFYFWVFFITYTSMLHTVVQVCTGVCLMITYIGITCSKPFCWKW